MFKKLVIFIGIFLLATTAEARAEERAVRTMALTADPGFAWLNGGVSATFALKVSDQFALIFLSSVGLMGWPGSGAFRADLGFGGRFFLTGMAFEDGWFVQPWIEGGIARDLQQTNDITNVILPSTVFGYSWYFDSGFTLGLSAGLQYVFITNNTFNRPLDLSGFLPVAQISLGFAW